MDDWQEALIGQLGDFVKDVIARRGNLITAGVAILVTVDLTIKITYEDNAFHVEFGPKERFADDEVNTIEGQGQVN